MQHEQVLAPPTRETARLYTDTPLGRAPTPSYRPSSPSRWAAAVAANIGAIAAGRSARRPRRHLGVQYQALYRHRCPAGHGSDRKRHPVGKFGSPRMR